MPGPRSPEPAVRLLDSETAGRPAVLDRIAAIINAAFELSEGEMFVPGRRRITTPEVAHLIQHGHLAVAELNDEIVGVIRLAQLGNDVGQWGLLAVAPDRHGQRIGARLVSWTEGWLADHGAREIQIQLLTPAAPSAPSPLKIASAAWYGRLGYARAETLNFSALHPAAAAELVVSTDFVTYTRRL